MRRPNRFTPTCVGTTLPSAHRRSLRSVHPHVRGDNRPASPRYRTGGGSPPRAWGQLRHARGKTAFRRFTPTCVGTTPITLLRMRLPSVHPHVRGDNAVDSEASASAAGSPPRAWGQLKPALQLGVENRFTPTCVGTTTAIVSVNEAMSVHPHVRGDNSGGSL